MCQVMLSVLGNISRANLWEWLTPERMSVWEKIASSRTSKKGNEGRLQKGSDCSREWRRTHGEITPVFTRRDRRGEPPPSGDGGKLRPNLGCCKWHISDICGRRRGSRVNIHCNSTALWSRDRFWNQLPWKGWCGHHSGAHRQTGGHCIASEGFCKHPWRPPDVQRWRLWHRRCQNTRMVLSERTPEGAQWNWFCCCTADT